jgi:hypothetical protein
MQTGTKWRIAGTAGLALTLALAAAAPSALAQDRALSASLAEQKASDEASIKSQKRVAQLADQTTDLQGEYRLTLQKLDRVRIYNNHLQKLVNEQETLKADVGRQLEDFQVVQTEIVPLMFDMIESLDQFIKLDMPFNVEERRDRMDTLRALMEDPDVTVSERYRKIMEAFQIETSFGRDVEATKGDLEGREVEFLRIGRVLLAYQTADRSETGFWNKTTGQWEVLGDEFRKPITDGLRIARKQAAPDLLMMPIPGPEAAQ